MKSPDEVVQDRIEGEERMTNEECRAEALRLAAQSKETFAEYERLAELAHLDEHELAMTRAAQQRQLGMLYAALAGGERA